MTRIAHLSDLHLLEDDWQKRCGLERYRLAFLSTGVKLDARERRDRALSMLNRARKLNVDHVLITGDLTEDGTQSQYETLAEVLHDSRIAAERVTIVPGNHDGYANGYRFENALEGPLAAYRRTSTPGAQHDVGDAAILPVSTVMDDQSFTRAAGIMRPKDVAAVAEAADDARAAGRTFIVAQHHSPLGYTNPVWNWFDGTMAAGAMKALLEDRSDIHVVHGHVHRRTTVSLCERSKAQIFSVDASRDVEHSLRIYRVANGELRAEGEATSRPQRGASNTLSPALA